MGKVQITEDSFGRTKQPGNDVKFEPVRRFTLSNSDGVRVQVITYGAIVTSFVVPDNKGRLADIVLGFDDITGYLGADNPYFGATVGRVCNRIAQGKFSLDGETYQLARNVGANHLHGGINGFSKFNWDAEILDDDKVKLTHVSEDGYEGYPGRVVATVTYQLTTDGRLKVLFNATTSKATPINLTNHSYFNLAGHDQGHDELYSHVILLNADHITETDTESIPTGQLNAVSGTPFDLRVARSLGKAMAKLEGIGFDDNYCVNQTNAGSKLQLVASVYHPASGRTLTVHSDQPGLQLYTSNYMPDPENNIYPGGDSRVAKSPNTGPAIKGKAEALYRKHGAFCLETQKYPDSVNQPTFASVIIHPNEVYVHQVEYKVTSA